ncbi:V-type ATP synthase subunit E [Clostridium sp. YIM B02505]|uniref:V-type proton ATPase subunit E n=1 Tax=Clostridium yunnanense TaxID=2800325 RepID=A0ABS1EIL2_9CLOT|nr:V-type ATP synthase subunit E family protein [Clostridium yunnanense]MBK1809214.1 V-type ATP synthase subunit E [Clostridium yunnanense]
MAKIEHLINKILEDAQAESRSIIEKAEAEKNGIVEKRVNEAKDIEKLTIEKAHREADLKKERIISNAMLKVRNDKLVAKQKVMDEVFNEALDELCAMPQEVFLSYLKATILSLNIKGDETIILNSYGKGLVDDSFIAELNMELSNSGKLGNLRLSETNKEFRGGFILEKNGVEINNTFEALISSYRDELEFEVANILFS